MPERGFLFFWIFLLFFSEFSSPCRVWTEIGAKFFFSLFLDLSTLVLAKNNSRKRFLNFLIFFFYFFQNFLARAEYEWNFGLKFFFFSFSVYLIPFWLKLIPKRDFLIFWFFLLFFSKFSCPSRVWTKLGTKIFISLSQPHSNRFG